MTHDIMKGAEPFYFASPSHKTLVILVHGFTSTCHSMRELGQKFFEAGFDACGILLPGHGTTPEDMEKRKWTEWLEAVENKLNELSTGYANVFLCGQSMGGCLCLYVSSFHPVTGVITISSGIKLFGWKLRLLPLIKYFTRFIKKYDGPDIKDPAAKKAEVHYDLMPIKSIMELQRFLKKLGGRMSHVKCPVLLIHAEQDHTFEFKNQALMFHALGSVNKKQIVLKNSYHIATVDYDKLTVQNESIQFIKETCK
ncbi:alpha/beta fold hydrolase [bacterium]|nr:alpha/beta fold hydrolase [bacterium]